MFPSEENQFTELKILAASVVCSGGLRVFEGQGRVRTQAPHRGHFEVHWKGALYDMLSSGKAAYKHSERYLEFCPSYVYWNGHFFALYALERQLRGTLAHFICWKGTQKGT